MTRPTNRTSGGGAGWSRRGSCGGCRTARRRTWCDVGCGTGALAHADPGDREPGPGARGRPVRGVSRRGTARRRRPPVRHGGGQRRRRLPAGGRRVRPGRVGAGAELRSPTRRGPRRDAAGHPAGRVGRRLRLGLRRGHAADPGVLGRRDRAGPRRRRAGRGAPVPALPARPAAGRCSRGGAGRRGTSRRSRSPRCSPTSTTCGARSSAARALRPATAPRCRRTAATPSATGCAAMLPQQADGTIPLAARAWAVRGHVPGHGSP